MQINIENKEDSAEKLAAVNGKPTKNYLFAPELNTIVRQANRNGVKAVPYTVGLEIEERTIVLVGNQLYLVSDTATLPFTCTDFSTELANGDWVAVNSGGTNPKTIIHDSNFPVHTGVAGATIVKTITIPANTIPANCYFRMLVTMKWTKSTSYKYFYTTIDSNNPNLRKVVNYIATATNNSAVDLQTVIRNCYVKDNVMHVTNTAHYRSDYAASDDEEISFDVTQDHDISFWCNVADTNDEMQILGVSIEVIF